VKISGDLDSLFTLNKPLKIVEIGGGYGGQCRMLCAMFPVSEYIIIDLPSVLELIHRYLDMYNIKNVKLYTPDQIPDSLPCDLLISNYAFSECTKEIQSSYIKKVLSHAKHGYMVCNNLNESYDNINCLTKNELLNILEKKEIFPQSLEEVPLIHPNNYLIVW